MEKTLIYQEGSGSIRQMPENYLVAHRGTHGGWLSDPDLSADPALCVKVYRTINHSYANRYKATGQEIVDMASKLTREEKPVKTLTCCCCGGTTRGRQWYNRDTGYGLCDRCAISIAASHIPRIDDLPAYMRSCYGIKGVHYCID